MRCIIAIIGIWLINFFTYLCTILIPQRWDECSEETLKKQEIKPESKLNFIYINKSVTPKLKMVAYFNIIYFFLALIVSIIIVILSNLGIEFVIKYILLIYIGVWLFTTGIIRFILFGKNMY